MRQCWQLCAEMALKPWHVIVSTDFEEAVLLAVSSLPSREQVKEQASYPVVCPPVCDNCLASNPPYACPHCGEAQYCSRRCQQMHFHVHARHCQSDNETPSIMTTTFIHVEIPSSLRSAPSSLAKTVATSDANARVRLNPRQVARNYPPLQNADS
mmetsp:Transcript_40279/g.79559  ORF Transcript_40279/g.79559 Transcript_40279/m.79559 type:complete len:155 (+) Transcript_40279:93-557(+)